MEWNRPRVRARWPLLCLQCGCRRSLPKTVRQNAYRKACRPCPGRPYKESSLWSLQRPAKLRAILFAGVNLITFGMNLQKRPLVARRVELRRHLLGISSDRTRAMEEHARNEQHGYRSANKLVHGFLSRMVKPQRMNLQRSCASANAFTTSLNTRPRCS